MSALDYTASARHPFLASKQHGTRPGKVLYLVRDTRTIARQHGDIISLILADNGQREREAARRTGGGARADRAGEREKARQGILQRTTGAKCGGREIGELLLHYLSQCRGTLKQLQIQWGRHGGGYVV